MDEDTEAALMSAGHKIDLLQRENGVLRAERDQALARLDGAVKLLTGIHSLLCPAPIKAADGRMMVFAPTGLDPRAALQEISDRIRALPEKMVVIGVVDS